MGVRRNGVHPVEDLEVTELRSELERDWSGRRSAREFAVYRMLGAEFGQDVGEPVKILTAWFWNDVNIARGSYDAVGGDGDASDDHVSDTGRVKRGDDRLRLERRLGHRSPVPHERSVERRGRSGWRGRRAARASSRG